jgi:capsular polysaccharide biosynthesis protein/Mrp family chromosome partitioning ATPase
MTGADVLRAMRARWLLFAVCCIVPLAAAFEVARTSAPVYTTTAEVFVAPARPATGIDTYPNALSAAELAAQQAPSYASLVDSPAVMRAVIADLHLPVTPSELADQVSAASPLNSVLIDITVRGGSAAAVKAIANDTAVRFTALAEKVAVAILGHRAVRPSVRLKLVKPALLPTAPISPHKTIDLALGLVVGLAVGLTAVILREKTDPRVRTVSQARSFTGSGFVTTVGDSGGRARSLIRRLGLPIRTADPGSSAAESFRRLRLSLTPALATRGAQSLAVTSLARGDAGPAVAANLALALAERGPTVLVDVDAHAGRIAGQFGMDSSLGVSTVISGGTPPESAFQPYHENLRILPAGLAGAGAQQPSPAVLTQLLDTLQGGYDYVIVHVGPILAHAVAAELSGAAHTVLLVAQQDKAKRGNLRQATEMLRSADADLVGVVLAPARLAVRPSEYRTGGPGPSAALAAANNGQSMVMPADLVQPATGSHSGPGFWKREQ